MKNAAALDIAIKAQKAYEAALIAGKTDIEALEYARKKAKEYRAEQFINGLLK